MYCVVVVNAVVASFPCCFHTLLTHTAGCTVVNHQLSIDRNSRSGTRPMSESVESSSVEDKSNG